MLSPEWQRIRLNVFRKYGKRCDCCRAVGQIQVHHLSYANWRNPNLNDVVPACYHCHAALKAEQSKSGLKGHALWAWHKKNCKRNRRR